jgi:hypothetical protein
MFRVSRLLGENRKVTVTFGKLICIASSHLSGFEFRCELIEESTVSVRHLSRGWVCQSELL